MKVHGYCTQCHKVKRVNASGHSLAMSSLRGGVVHGICDDCMEPTSSRGKGASVS